MRTKPVDKRRIPQEDDEFFDYLYDVDDEYIDELDDTTELYFNKDKYNNELKDIFQSVDEKNKIKEENNTKPVSLDEASERLKLDQETVHAFTDGIKQDRKLKKEYATKLIRIFSLQLVIFNAIFILCGRGILKYSDTTLNIFITGCLIEVIALIKIIVSYLFADNTSQSLNNILEKNKVKKD